MQKRLILFGVAMLAFVSAVSPAQATLVQITLTGTTEDIHDNADVFGFGTGQLLTSESFAETLW